MIKSIKAKVIDSCIKVIIDRPVIRSHHLVRKIPSYFDEVESRCQSNQEARPVSTPVCCTCHSCAHPRCQQSHAKQMGIDVGEDFIWMTRPDQSLDPLDGPVCCSAIPSADPQLLETYDLVEKKVMCWIPSIVRTVSQQDLITGLSMITFNQLCIIFALILSSI